MAIESYFKNIADAIREKAGTSGLITPAQMPQAIADIPTGGGGGLFAPVINQLSYGLLDAGDFKGSWYKTNSIAIYDVKAGDKLLFALTPLSNVNRNMFLISFFNRPYTDFLNYINSGSAPSVIYTGSTIANYPNVRYGNPASCAVEYQCANNGTIIFQNASATSTLYPMICVKE